MYFFNKNGIYYVYYSITCFELVDMFPGPCTKTSFILFNGYAAFHAMGVSHFIQLFSPLLGIVTGASFFSLQSTAIEILENMSLYLHFDFYRIKSHHGNAESKDENILIAVLKLLFQKIAIPLSCS